MKNNAHTPNPFLAPLGVLVGHWQTAGTHPYFPGLELRGRAEFEWIEGGAFLKMSTSVDHPDFPDGVAIFGSDDESGEIRMLYFDERGVSRVQNVRLEGNRLKWWRNSPTFSQRFSIAIADDGASMVGTGEMRREGADWEKDLDLTYARVPQAGG